jgi:hypothetical protein
MQRRRASSRRFKIGTCQLREKTLTEKHRSSRITGGWHRVRISKIHWNWPSPHTHLTSNRWWMKCRPRRLTNEQGKSVLPMYVVFTTRVTLCLPVFLLEARVDDRRGWYIIGSVFFYFLQIYNLLYKLSNKQICYKETLVRSNHPILMLLCIL